ncbi:hypothetical protein RRG08_054108 [Elysia crispata]|uniref:Uncharacterized protein n=1 Tax=Elysia crispata TaxID=231223 RepID=A0AAE0ZD31_9GAST|nr:hypothetical protein RRG08_054108 [Elysia crispata]
MGESINLWTSFVSKSVTAGGRPFSPDLFMGSKYFSRVAGRAGPRTKVKPGPKNILKACGGSCKSPSAGQPIERKRSREITKQQIVL